MRRTTRCICPSLHRRPVRSFGADYCDRCLDAGCSEQAMGARCPGWKSRPRFPNLAPVPVEGGPAYGSKGERDRGRQLALLDLAGAIKNLQRQVTYQLDVVGVTGEVVHCGTWRADFVYTRTDTGEEVVEDYKDGKLTDRHRMQAALMYAAHGIRIFYSGTEQSARIRRPRARRAR